MSRPAKIMIVAALLAALGAQTGCRQAEAVVSENDVLGTWEIKSWKLNHGDARFNGCDMLGTLTFSRQSWGGIRVFLGFSRDGSARTLWGDVDLTQLPVVMFTCNSGQGFPDDLAFKGLIADGSMFGFGGFCWDIRSYDDWEWEAVKN